MIKTMAILLTSLAVVCFSAATINAHCEIPCGIYGDSLRIQQISEHITTIEKSMKRIAALNKENPANSNQLVRWVSNKEQHATEIQHIVTQYFMTQRIKPKAGNYDNMLSALHKMLIASMKCKQTTDLEHIKTLRSLLGTFESLYFKKKM